MSPLASAFFQLAVEEGSTASLEVIRNAALAKIVAGEAKSLVNSSVGGKSFGFSVSLSADKLFAEISVAIRTFNTGLNKVVEFDFSRLSLT